MLHQNESQGAILIAATKAVCSQAVMEAKTNYQTAIMEAKMAKHCLIQEAKVTHFKAISDAKVQTTSQAVMFQEEHYNYLRSLEEQALGEESRSHHDILSSCQAALCHSSHLIRGTLAVSYHLLLGQTPPLSSLVQLPRTSPVEEQTSSATPPMPMPKQSLRPKRHHPLPELMGDMPLGGATPVAAIGGTPHPNKWETPPWFKSLKPSLADAFLRDSDIVVEASLLFFSKHSHNFSQDGNCDLSKVFKKLAKKASLLGTGIYEIQACCTGPEELKQANYTLWSLPKGLKFLRAVPAMESPKVMGLMGIHDPDALQCFAGFTYCPWCGKEGQNEGTVVIHLRTTHYKQGLVCDKCYGCPTITSDTLHCHGHHKCCRVITPFDSVPSA